jgi:hypothetical protein
MLMILLATAIAGSSPSPHILTRFDEPDLVAAGLSVDLILPPPGVTARHYSSQLVAAAGIAPRSPGDPIDSGMRTRFGAGAAAVWGNDGRSEVVYYPGEPVTDPRKNKVCRISASRVAPFPVRWQAIRWCHARLGYQTPENPPPIDD